MEKGVRQSSSASSPRATNAAGATPIPCSPVIDTKREQKRGTRGPKTRGEKNFHALSRLLSSSSAGVRSRLAPLLLPLAPCPLSTPFTRIQPPRATVKLVRTGLRGVGRGARWRVWSKRRPRAGSLKEGGGRRSRRRRRRNGFFFPSTETHPFGASRGRSASSTSPLMPSTGREDKELARRQEGKRENEEEETHLLCGHDCCCCFF